jgi:type II secretory pathway pseudopilin PulG
MRNPESGLTFVDVLIIIAIVLLLASLAIPRFRKAPDYGDELDEDTNAVAFAEATNAVPAATNAPGPVEIE